MALLTRRVLLSLFAGIIAGELILNHFSLPLSLSSLAELFMGLLSQQWVLKTLAFAVMVGGVMALISKSGGVNGFVYYIRERRSLVTSPRASLMLAYIVGVVIFIESSITSLIAGTVSRPLTDAYGVSRAKLAYVCDSTSAPVCSLIVLNGWGALLLGLVSAQISAGMLSGESVEVLLKAIPYNFYAMTALVVTFAVIWFNIDIGPMRHAEVIHEEAETYEKGNMGYMVWPIVVMIGSVFAVLFITGDGNLLKGSGSTAIFYTMIITLLFCLVYYRSTGGMSVRDWAVSSVAGMRSMVGIAAILLFAFAIGDVTKELETGLYLASYAKEVLSPIWLGAVVFFLSAVMAFATGTSWGTFSIMIPIAVPLAVAMDAEAAICIGAVISGGVFGDHCSPISDTTIISSMGAKCDHIEHVKTQLPYALISGAIAMGLFMLFGWMG